MSEAHKIKLLAVDDNKVVLRVLRDGLDREGFEVRTASDGVEALEQVLLDKPDIILLDIVMPGVTGYEVCRVLRSDAATAKIPIIMVTASTPDKVRKEGYEAGANDIWAKPVNVAEIAQTIRNYLASGVKYEPVTGAKELDILRQNLTRLVGELKTPVQAIATLTQMLDEGPSLQLSQVAEVLRQQIERAQEIVHKLERLTT